MYILRGWSAIWPMASLTDMDSHTGDSMPSREHEAFDSEKDLGF